MDRTGGRTRRLARRPGTPARASAFGSGAVDRRPRADPGSWNQRTAPPNSRGLVDGLARAPVAQLGGPVGGADEQRHPRVVRLDHGGMQVDRRGTRRAAHDGGPAGRQTDAERAKPGRPLVEHDVDPEPAVAHQVPASAACSGDPGDTTAGGDPGAHPLVDERPRERGRHIEVAHRATIPVWTTQRPESGARSRLHPDGRVVARRAPHPRRVVRGRRRSTCPSATTFAATAAVDRDAGQARRLRRATRWAAASRCGSRSTAPISCRRSCSSARPRASPDERRAPSASRRPTRRSPQSVEREGVDAFLERWLAQPLFATVPPDAPGLSERRGLSARYLAHCLRVLGAGAMEPMWDRLGELRDAGRAGHRSERRQVREARTRDARTHPRRRRAHSPRRRACAPARSSRRVLGGFIASFAARHSKACTISRPTGRSRAAPHSTSWKRTVPTSAAISPGGSWRVNIARTGATASGSARTASNALGTNAPHATTATIAPGDARDVKTPGPRCADANRERALARDPVGVDVADVVREQDPAGREPDRERGDPRDAGQRGVLHVGAADRCDEAEEHEHHHLAETDVAVRLGPARVGDRGDDRGDADEQQPRIHDERQHTAHDRGDARTTMIAALRTARGEAETGRGQAHRSAPFAHRCRARRRSSRSRS